jgi:hypothetical protein
MKEFSPTSSPNLLPPFNTVTTGSPRGCLTSCTCARRAHSAHETKTMRQPRTVHRNRGNSELGNSLTGPWEMGGASARAPGLGGHPLCVRV